MISLIGNTILFIICMTFIIYCASLCQKSLVRQRRLVNRPVGHRRVADYSVFNAETLDERLKLRAKANARLVEAFDIENSFTTTDVSVHRRFLKRANDAIRLPHAGDWVRLSEVADTMLDLSVSHLNKGFPCLPLAPLVRVLGFGIVLNILFDVEPSMIDLNCAQDATNAINHLWIQSKDYRITPSLYQRKLLDHTLRRLLPREFPCDDRSHPLNLIMPAYETLWRVVVLTFVEAAGRNEDPNTAKQLLDAVKNVPQCFGQRDDPEIQALAFAKEGLRLYPPTKRIYRATSTAHCDRGVTTANVEGCHRNTSAWGSDALEFKPARFHEWPRQGATNPLVQLMHPELYRNEPIYMPFGVGKHICPAAAGFGERLITLLIVKLTQRFGTRQTGLELYLGDDDVQQRPATPLPSGRGDMEQWVIEMKGDEQ
ncbi:cytochrome P450 [Xylariaceae sp. FL1651]|nr:cytochrome P450 [Xylariaceae sp. FL1651]